MASVATNKNSFAQDMASKAPWTDERGIAVKVYHVLVTAFEIFILWFKMTSTWIYAIYLLFVPPEPKSVRGEKILITGTGHGIGRELALRFARLGATVVCVDINPVGNKETIDMVKGEKGKAYQYECDVSNRESVLELAEKIRREVGDITFLVNNAGVMPCKSLLQHSPQEINKIMDVNVLAHFWLLQAFLPSMMEKNHGHIVAMSSMAGMVGLRNLVPYCASKFAVRGLMEALHEELREDPKGYTGIKFTVICPFIVDTGLCKRPKIKHPGILKIVNPQDAADSIIDAVRRDYYEITIPSGLLYINQICRAMPRTVPMHLKDWLDSGLDAAE